MKLEPEYDMILAEMLEKDCDMFKGTDGALYMSLPTPRGAVTYPVRNAEGMARVAATFTEKHGHPFTTTEQQRATQIAWGRMVDNPARDVFTRVGKQGEDFYLDLHSSPKKYVKYNAQGWLVTDNVPVHFQEGQGQLPMPEPLGGMNDFNQGFDALRSLLTVNEMQWRCLLPIMVNYLLPHLQQPVLLLSGVAKSGKSTFIEIVKTMVDPNLAMLGGEVPDTRDLFIKVSAAWVATFDNLTKISEAGMNAICQLATGGTFSTRRLYENTDQVMITCRNPVIIAGISNVATRPDVADRAVPFELTSVDNRPEPITQEEIRERLHKAAPSILNALLYLTCDVLKQWADTKAPQKVRPVSFGIIGRAVEKSMGWKQGSFELAYHTIRKPLEASVLEEYAVITALTDLLETKVAEGQFRAQPYALLEMLKGGKDFDMLKAFPQKVSTFSKQLKECTPAIRSQYGWDVQDSRDWKGRWWNFTYLPTAPTEPTAVPKKVTPPEVKELLAANKQTVRHNPNPKVKAAKESE